MRSGLADEGLHRFGVSGDPLWGDGDSRFAHQKLGLFPLFRQNDSDDITGATRARRTPGPMQISLVLGRGIDVHDEFDVVDVNTDRKSTRLNSST